MQQRGNSNHSYFSLQTAWWIGGKKGDQSSLCSYIYKLEMVEEWQEYWVKEGRKMERNEGTRRREDRIVCEYRANYYIV